MTHASSDIADPLIMCMDGVKTVASHCLPGIVDNLPTAWRRGSVICDATEYVCVGVRFLLGDGLPDPGDRYAGSGSMFDEVSAQVTALVPGGGWRGCAARAYAAQSLAQSARAKMVGDLDRHTRDLVAAQSDAVTRVRSVVITVEVFVACLGVCCLALEAQGPTGQAVSFFLALDLCSVALAALIGGLISLAVTTSRNASSMQDTTRRLTTMMTTLPTLSPAVAGLPDEPLADALADLPNDTQPIPQIPDAAVIFAQLPGLPEFSLPTAPSPGFPDFGAPHLPIPTLVGLPRQPDVFRGLRDVSSSFAGPLPATGRQLNGGPGITGRLGHFDSTAAAGTTAQKRVPAGAATAPSPQPQKRVC
ncbi:ESX-1 secretion-associated protein EspA [Mycobacterium marinum]|uniref:EspA/EspE family type VII secretion system effector n=1 Tax=Mycobacterium marinum TaxID=1781 RepID=UPI000E3BB373|nr:EspA/EspE family type VII secretion system effector [Mycobacterium marinum]RFZ47784.1 ESX-1 secretion-associated protein EspA [Mycobacterium marinum]